MPDPTLREMLADEGVTPGPWRDDGEDVVSTPYNSVVGVRCEASWDFEGCGSCRVEFQNAHDRAFIARARNLFPLLRDVACAAEECLSADIYVDDDEVRVEAKEALRAALAALRKAAGA